MFDQAKLIWSQDPWYLFYQEDNGKFYLYTSDYHPDPLPLRREDLLEWLRVMDYWSQVMAAGFEKGFLEQSKPGSAEKTKGKQKKNGPKRKR